MLRLKFELSSSRAFRCTGEGDIGCILPAWQLWTALMLTYGDEMLRRCLDVWAPNNEEDDPDAAVAAGIEGSAACASVVLGVELAKVSLVSSL